MDTYSETVIVNTGISRKMILLTMVKMRRSPLTDVQRVTDIKYGSSKRPGKHK